MTEKTVNIKPDCVILGGGIAGLWLLNRLKQQGYKVILLESDAIGSGQTIKSQGIIHGGLKYALNGSLSSATDALSDMPTRWQNCLAGQGEIDLNEVRVLANGQHMWSINKLTGGITTLFAGAAMHSKVKQVSNKDCPAVLNNSAKQGKVYKLEEIVLDVPSLIKALANKHISDCIKISADAYKFKLDEQNNIQCIQIIGPNQNINIQAQRYILTAGNGNLDLSKNLPNPPTMQRRPLHMVVVKSNKLAPLYGHCIGLGTTPRLTVTTHISHDHIPVWYLGGKLAEEGINLTAEQQINTAQTELAKIFPNIDLSDAKWASFFVDRAEAKQADGSKPNSATVFAQNNAIIAWPTKLALAPILSDTVLSLLKQDKITPSNDSNTEHVAEFSKPVFATPIWDQLL